jgi:hypothetical protein
MTLRLLYLLFCQVLGWLALLSRSAAARTPSCWCCATRSRCCNARSPGRSWTGPTGRCWPGRRGCCPDQLGGACWCSRRRCCAGIGSWCGAAGATRTVVAGPVSMEIRALVLRLARDNPLGVSPRPWRVVPPRVGEQDRGQHRVDHRAPRRRRSGAQTVSAYLQPQPAGRSCPGWPPSPPPAYWPRSAAGGGSGAGTRPASAMGDPIRLTDHRTLAARHLPGQRPIHGPGQKRLRPGPRPSDQDIATRRSPPTLADLRCAQRSGACSPRRPGVAARPAADAAKRPNSSLLPPPQPPLRGKRSRAGGT